MSTNTKKAVTWSTGTEEEKARLEEIAKVHGFRNASDMSRYLTYGNLSRLGWSKPEDVRH